MATTQEVFEGLEQIGVVFTQVFTEFPADCEFAQTQGIVASPKT